MRYAITAFSPEQRLLLYGARLEVTAATAAEIKSLVGSGLDWDRVIAYASQHQVAPLLHRTLTQTVPEQAPAAVMLAFSLHMKRYGARYRLQYQELLRVLDVLTTNQIPVIPFKGPTLGRLVYRDLVLRPFSDLDFLLRAADVDRALSLLEPLGYVYRSPLSAKQERYARTHAGQCAVMHQATEIWLEPHWSVAQRVFAIELDYPALWRRSTELSLDGMRVKTFAPHDQLLVLCVHGFREQWRLLKWVCDVAEIVRRDPHLDGDAMIREARAVGCERLLRLGLSLAVALLDAPVVVHPDRRTEALVGRVCDEFFQDHKTRPSVWTVNTFYLDGRERLRDKLRYALRAQFAPRPSQFDRVRLPDWLFFAYYPIRWVHDYLLLPIWTLWRYARRGLVGQR